MKTISLASALFGVLLLAILLNVYFRLIMLPEMSLGGILLSEIGHADGIKLAFRLFVDLAAYFAICYLSAFLILKFIRKRGGDKIS